MAMTYHEAEKFFFSPHLAKVRGEHFSPRTHKVYKHTIPDRPQQHPLHGSKSLQNLRKMVSNQVDTNGNKFQVPQIKLSKTSPRRGGKYSMLDLQARIGSKRHRAGIYSSNPTLGPQAKGLQVETNLMDWRTKSMPEDLDKSTSSKKFKMEQCLTLPVNSRLPEIHVKPGQIILDDSNLLGQEEIEESDPESEMEEPEENLNRETGYEADSDDELQVRANSAGSTFSNMARRVDREIDANWVLENNIQNTVKEFERKQKELAISVPDEDTMESIDRRLQEVKQMSKPRRDQRYVLDRVDPEYRDRILKIKDTPLPALQRKKKKVPTATLR